MQGHGSRKKKWLASHLLDHGRPQSARVHLEHFADKLSVNNCSILFNGLPDAAIILALRQRLRKKTMRI
jgi:hypothetical protein